MSEVDDSSEKKAKTGGRAKGTPNKVTQEIKAGILAAFNTVGGAEYLVGQAKENPVAFMGLLGKILPSEIKAELSGVDGAPMEANNKWSIEFINAAPTNKP